MTTRSYSISVVVYDNLDPVASFAMHGEWEPPDTNPHFTVSGFFDVGGASAERAAKFFEDMATDLRTTATQERGA